MDRSRTLLLFLALAGCTSSMPGSGPSGTGPAGKEDSGWLGSNSYELGGRATGQVRQRIGETVDGTWVADETWGELATSEKLQLTLIDQQLRFAKNTLEDQGYDLNQLVDTYTVTNVEEADGYVTLTYEAVVDMVGQLPRNGQLPTLQQLPRREFEARVPLEPNAITEAQVAPCARETDAALYSLYYYFDASRQGCDVVTTGAAITISEIFERRASYPEYDQLRHEAEDGTVGFTVALIPGETENATDERAMLVNRLRLTGTRNEERGYERFVLDRNGVQVTIDMYDPDRTEREATFYSSLTNYDVVHYNGHSSYGTREFLTHESAFSDRYQIIMMHSCRSYPYYTRQVFRAKATDQDPRGWAAVDVVATGKSSYANDAATTLEILLTSLADGVASLDGASTAPDWLSIVRRMNEATYMTVLYGVAGVRTNTFQP